jgi:hypothetical protein
MECLNCPNYWGDRTECENCQNKITFAEWYIKTSGKMPPLFIEGESK